MARWSNETKWDSTIDSVAGTLGVPGALIRAIIATESQFRPEVSRQEPSIRDASIGLMQILFSTAKGEGYSGVIGDPKQLTGLYDPSSNIYYGTSYLKEQFERAGGDVARTASAYNGGWRPELGFGTQATKPVTICLARDQVSGKCVKTRNVRAGEFGNQPYVDAVMDNLKYFQQSVSVATMGAASPLSSADQSEPQTDRRTSGAVNRFTWFALWQAVMSWFK